MSDCISRKAIIDMVEKQYCAPCKRQGGDLDEDHCCSCVINDVLEKVRRIPAAEVAPVVHSYWEHKIANDGENIAICHNCKYPVSWFWEQTPYCVNCWAKMDLEEPNELDKR